MSEDGLRWCGVPVLVRDDVPHDEFIMPLFNTNPKQQPAFFVTQQTLDLVTRRLDEYTPVLERLLSEWRENKERFIEAVASGARPTRPLKEGDG